MPVELLLIINTRPYCYGVENERADAGRDGRNLTRETKLSGANGDREYSIFPVQLTTSKIGNHARLMTSLLKVMTTHKHTPGQYYQ